jgi:hypothetical protein
MLPPVPAVTQSGKKRAEFVKEAVDVDEILAIEVCGSGVSEALAVPKALARAHGGFE